MISLYQIFGCKDRILAGFLNFILMNTIILFQKKDIYEINLEFKNGFSNFAALKPKRFQHIYRGVAQLG